MKYLLTIIAFVILNSALTLYYLWFSDLSKSQDVALSINGHQISQQQIDEHLTQLAGVAGNLRQIAVFLGKTDFLVFTLRQNRQCAFYRLVNIYSLLFGLVQAGEVPQGGDDV